MKSILRYLHLVALLAATAWLAHEQTWESIVVFITTAIGFLAYDIDLRKPSSSEWDSRLFDDFLSTFTNNGSISFLRDHDIQIPFPLSRLDELRTFREEWIDAAHEFQDHRLERDRKELWKYIDEYLPLLASKSFSTGDGYQEIPKQWKYDHPEEYDKLIANLYRLGDKIVELHQAIVRRGKKIVSVSQ